MSTLNRVDWEKSPNTLSRENLNKMTSGILNSASVSKLNTAREFAQNAYSTKEISTSSTNSILVEDATRTEIYTLGKNNLLTGSYENGNGQFVDHLNPLPAGRYVFYAYSSASSGAIKLTIKQRIDRKKDDATNKNNVVTLVGTSVNYNTPYYFDAPQGLDYITTVKTNTSTVSLVLLKEENYNGIKNIALTPQDNTNILPYPYQYDYSKSAVDRFVDGSPVIDTIKFTDQGDGSILVERANSSVGNTNKNILFYLFNGSELRLEPGDYTVGCKIYNKSGSLWPGDKVFCRFQARWEDGDSSSYYEETTYEDGTSTQHVTNDKPVTFNAFNGIRSIIMMIYIRGTFETFPENGLIVKPTLCKGKEEIEFTPYTSGRNIVYKYSSNLLRPYAPRIYSSSDNGVGIEGTTTNGITVTSEGRGYYSLNGTATKDAIFRIGIGRQYMNPKGTLYFGGIPSTAPSGVRMRITINDSVYWADPGTKAAINVSSGMDYYSNVQVRISSGTVCNNVLITPQLSLGNVEYEPFEMPIAIGGPAPSNFAYYQEANSTYISNPSFKLVADAWKNLKKLSQFKNDIVAIANAESILYDIHAQYTDLWYFSDFVEAVNKVGSGIVAGEIWGTTEGLAKGIVYLNADGTPVVVLKEDASVDSILYINADMIINLNGKCITLASGARLQVVAGVNAKIDGRIAGSKISRQLESSEAIESFVYVYGNLEVIGGEYSAQMMSASKSAYGFVSFEGGGNLLIKDATVKTFVGNYTGTSNNTYVASIVVRGQCEIDNSIIIADTTSTVHPGDYQAFCVYAGLDGCKIKILNSKLTADGLIGSFGRGLGVSNAIALKKNCDATIINCDVYGTHCGISTSTPNLYVNGGTYRGVAYGGIYFTNLSTDSWNAKSYIENATIASAKYEGSHKSEYRYFTEESGVVTHEQYDEAGFYVGGGAGANNISVYLDNCQLISGNQGAFVLRGTDGEENNSVYMSNCTVVGENKTIRVDNNTYKVFLGFRNNITAENVSLPEVVTNTREVYIKEEA